MDRKLTKKMLRVWVGVVCWCGVLVWVRGLCVGVGSGLVWRSVCLCGVRFLFGVPGPGTGRQGRGRNENRHAEIQTGSRWNGCSATWRFIILFSIGTVDPNIEQQKAIEQQSQLMVRKVKWRPSNELMGKATAQHAARCQSI